jgi:serine/threonine-protein kinase
VPFEAETMPQLCGMILQDPPRPIHELRPDLPQGLQEAVLRCLEKSRERRYGNVAELAFALAPFGLPAAQRSAERIARVLGAAGHLSAPTPIASAVSARAGSATSTDFVASNEPKKSRTALFVALCLVGLLLGVALLVLTRKNTALESIAEPPSSTPLAAAPTLGAAPPIRPSVEPQLVAPSAAPALSAASAAPAPAGAPTTAGAPAASESAKVAVKAKAKASGTKTRGATPPPAQPVTPAIDPLDGRR